MKISIGTILKDAWGNNAMIVAYKANKVVIISLKDGSCYASTRLRVNNVSDITELEFQEMTKNFFFTIVQKKRK